MSATLALLTLLAAGALAAAVYAHRRLPRYTAGAGPVRLTRAILVGVGAAVGYVGASYAADPLLGLLAFLAGLGVVHVPAAAILFIKEQRGAAKS